MKTTRSLTIDIESYSSVDLKSCGVYKYVEPDDFQILLFAYAFDEDPVEVVDLTEEELSQHLIDALLNPTIIKRAYNAQFERTCLSKHLGIPLDPAQWNCTQVLASAAGLPGHLAEVAKVLHLDQQKMDAGKQLIPYFCKPCAPTKTNHQRTRNLPHHDPAKWELFKRYNAQDVETERAVYHSVDYTFTPREREVYILDQRINDRGVEIDLQLVEAILQYNDAYSETLYSRAKLLSGLENPNNRNQLVAWLREQGIDVDNTRKETVKDILGGDTNAEVAEMLKLRQEMAKSSIKKYDVMDRATCGDGRIRGTLQYYGANRTGRWAGRLVQVQNLPKTFLKELGSLRELIKRGDFETLEVTYDAIVDVFSQLIRTAFVAKEGHVFVVNDFSAIEARVIAWLANEKWRLDVFSTHGKIYEASASQMFKVPLEEITKSLRSKGKVAELACIAEGQLVLTERGLVPIEEVTLRHKVWDGENFVSHEGVIYQGRKEVLTYDGLTATADHLVYIEGEDQPIRFDESAHRGSCLKQYGAGRKNLRPCENHQSGETLYTWLERMLCASGVYRLWKKTMELLSQSNLREVQGLSDVFEASTDSVVVRPETSGRQTTLHQSERCGISELWWARHSLRLRQRHGSRVVDHRQPWFTGSELGNGSDRCERQLRTGESSLHHQTGEQPEQKDYDPIGMESGRMAVRVHPCPTLPQCGNDPRASTGYGAQSRPGEAKELASDRRLVRVYDIKNAGPNHRYTVSNVLVHNCGYGGGPNALIKMGALKMGLIEEELQGTITAWRKANPSITRLWKNVEACARRAIEIPNHEADLKSIHPGCPVSVIFKMNGSNLEITLPSTRRLCYVDATVEGDGPYSRIRYSGLDQTTKKWSRQDTYSGRLVENIIQAIARDCLAETMLRIDENHYPIVFHVHDEVIVEVPADDAEDDLNIIKDIMATPFDWAPGLNLKAEGFCCDFYLKD